MSAVSGLAVGQGAGTPILSLAGVVRQFSRQVPPAVGGVSLALAAGELLALLGPSGCGKTTLLRLIAGFEVPQAGTIAIGGATVAGEGNWVPPERRGVGMVFQDYALFPHLTVAENVAFGLSSGTGRGRGSMPQVKAAIELVKLQGLEGRYPHQLSGGQQQRVALARALAPQPALVLLDEPLSNLDVQVRVQLRQELRSIVKTAGATAVLVTHDQEEALSIADRVGVMRGGKLEQLGTPEQVYQQPSSAFVAQFVAQANMLRAARRGDYWLTAIGKLPVGGVMGERESARVLVRQEDLRLEWNGTGEWTILDRQFLGREYRYVVQKSGAELMVVRCPIEHKFELGDRVDLGFREDAIYLTYDELD